MTYINISGHDVPTLCRLDLLKLFNLYPNPCTGAVNPKVTLSTRAKSSLAQFSQIYVCVSTCCWHIHRYVYSWRVAECGGRGRETCECWGARGALPPRDGKTSFHAASTPAPPLTPPAGCALALPSPYLAGENMFCISRLLSFCLRKLQQYVKFGVMYSTPAGKRWKICNFIFEENSLIS